MNYEFKGTPGPWVISYRTVDMESKNPLNGEFNDIHCATTISCGKSNLALASTLGIDTGFGSSSWVPRSEAIPNAQLVASAPDLLQALIAMVDFPDEFLKEWEFGEKCITVTYQPFHIHQAIEAIRKALNINQ